MSRDEATRSASMAFDDGTFLRMLKGRIAQRTESEAGDGGKAMDVYLRDIIVPSVEDLGFTTHIFANPTGAPQPFLVAERLEDPELPTVLLYGHGDTVSGDAANWRSELDPWNVTIEGDRWYGRGTADNKGQHTINLLSLGRVLQHRGGSLGFNVKLLMEMGEELGSPGLRELCREKADMLRADLLIASDGPRLSAERPTIFLGSRGGYNFELSVKLRDQPYHSGNWGGLLRNPGTVLAAAVACLVDGNGRICVKGLRPPPIPSNVRAALSEVKLGSEATDPKIDVDWGEPGLSPEERVFGWNALEVLAFETGNPRAPVNAVPPRADATLQLRFVVGTDWQGIPDAVRNHLDSHGFPMVEVRPSPTEVFLATRLDLEDPWVTSAADSIIRTTNKKPALLPNFGGSLPNDAFSEILGLPTLWIPHSYPACAQHAPNEHLLGSVAREGLSLMAGLFWDLAEAGPNILAQKKAAAKASVNSH